MFLFIYSIYLFIYKQQLVTTIVVQLNYVRNSQDNNISFVLSVVSENRNDRVKRHHL
jgi:hypothetical protein